MHHTHVLVFVRVTIIVQEPIGVGTLDHLHEYWCELPFQCQKSLSKSCCCHLDPPLIAGVDLKVMAVG